MKIRYIFRILLLFGLLLYPAGQLFSALTVSASSINTVDLPRFTTELSVFRDGVPVQVDAEDIFIIEDNKSTQPMSVSTGSGAQTVEWITRYNSFSGVNSVRFIVVYDKEIGETTISFSQPDYGKIIFTTIKNEVIEEITFGNVSQGEKEIEQVFVTVLRAKRNEEGQETAVHLDSATLSSNDYTYNWQGHEFNRNPPPVWSEPGDQSLVDLFFSPSDNEYHRDKFKVYYDGGIVESLTMVGNRWDIPSKTLLNLERPNGGEILVPCRTYKIRWTGASPDIPVIVEFSTDNGITWNQIGKTMDSSLYWNVPKIYTDDGLIRLRQEFTKQEFHNISPSFSPIQKIAYNQNGSRLIAGDASGILYEFSAIGTPAKSAEYSLRQSPAKVKFFGIEYLADGTSFVAAYELSGSPGTDSLAFFRRGERLPYLKAPVPNNFETGEMHIDSTRSIIGLTPELGSTVYIMSAEDGSFIRELDFKAPVNAMSFNKHQNQAAVYLLPGYLQILNVPDFTVEKEIDLRDTPIALEMALSPDGLYAAIGCKPPIPTIYSSNRTETHVISLETEAVVRTLRETASEPVGMDFNPTSNILLLGSKGQPQIALWDLTTDEFIGSLSGSTTALTDFKFSPEGHSLAVSSGSTENLIVRNFTFPESDISDSTFRIVGPEVDLDTMLATDTYIQYDNPQVQEQSICNTGEVPITFDFIKFRDQIHFRLESDLHPLTLEPGECADIPYIFNPQDTGRLYDTLIFTSNCFGDYKVVVEGTGLNRNIAILQEDFDFGEQCIEQKHIKEFAILRNDDPVPLMVNYFTFDPIDNTPFGVDPPMQDTVLQPGETLTHTLYFYPRELGPHERTMIIAHSGLPKFNRTAKISGFGIGTFLEVSHPDLAYIPEIKSRTAYITNSSETDATILSADINPEGNFRILTDFPIDIAAGETIEIEVEWLTDEKTGARLSLEVVPCGSAKGINLAFYKATSNVSIPAIEADPSGNATIPVNYETFENYSYNGERFFETEFTMNPRHFLPQEVRSDFGTGELTRNEIINDMRHIGIRVTGNFPPNGTVAEVRGVAGLDSTLESDIKFMDGSEFWGSAVTTNYFNGVFRLINIEPDRRVIHHNAPQIIALFPNPADEGVNLEISNEIEGRGSIEIYDQVGRLVYSRKDILMNKGSKEINIDLSQIRSGTYRIVAAKDGVKDSKILVIVR